MANRFPPNHNVDLREDKLVQPELTPVMLELAPLVPEQVLPKEEEDPKEEEFEEEEEPQEEEEFKDDMDMDFYDEMDGLEVIHPYEVEAGSFLSPPGPDSEPKDETVPTGRSTHQLLPPVRRFSERPRDATTVLVAHLDPDDPYVSAATGVPIVHEETLSPELRGSPRDSQMSAAAIERLVTNKVTEAISADSATKVNASGAGGSRGTCGPAEAPVVRECTFIRFMKCNLTVFHGTEGVWNSHVATKELEAANRTIWIEMKKLMTKEFFPAEEIQRMEYEKWNLMVKDFNMPAYTQRFNELALLCPKMVLTERKKIEAYIWGLTENIKGEVTSSKPTILNEALQMAHTLMEQKAHA
nr:hypothetical protein [Tanacetum cinerariifolium]